MILNVIEFYMPVEKKKKSFNDAELKKCNGTNDSPAFVFRFGTATSIFTP